MLHEDKCRAHLPYIKITQGGWTGSVRSHQIHTSSSNWSSHYREWGSLITVVKHQSSHWRWGKLSFGPLDIFYHSFFFVLGQTPHESCVRAGTVVLCILHRRKNRCFCRIVLVGNNFERSFDLTFSQAGSVAFRPPCINAAFGFLQHEAGLVVNKPMFL